MKRLSLIPLVLLMLLLPGCGPKSEAEAGTLSAQTAYSSDTPPEDCYLCGGIIEEQSLIDWGQDNIALISFNTFEIIPLEINHYDRLSGQMIRKPAGTMSLGGGRSQDGGFSADMMLDYDRGYADGTVDFHNDEVLDMDRVATFLCADCLNKILPRELDQCFGVGVIHLATKEVCVLEESVTGFGLGDFYIDCDLRNPGRDDRQMDFLAFYCPVRYPSEP